MRNDHRFGVLANEKRNRSASIERHAVQLSLEGALRLAAAGESSEQPSPAPVGR